MLVRLRTAVLLVLLLLTPGSLQAGRVPFGVLTVDASPVALRVGTVSLIAERSSRLLLVRGSADAAPSGVELLEGAVWVAPDGETDVEAGGLRLVPRGGPALCSVVPGLWTLLPNRPATVAGAGTVSLSDLRGLRVRDLPPGVQALLDGGAVRDLPPRSAPLPEPPGASIRLGFGAREDQPLLTVAPADLTFRVTQTQRLMVPVRSNDLYVRHSMLFLPRELRLSLDGDAVGDRCFAVLFDEDLKAADPYVRNLLRTGTGAALRFLTAEGYVVILGPGSAVEVATVTSEGAGSTLRLREGAALVLPPESDDPAASVPPLHMRRAARHVIKAGPALLLADDPAAVDLLPFLTSLPSRTRLEREIHTALGRLDLEMQQLDLAAAEPATATTAAEARLPLLERYARAREGICPLLSPLTRMPCRVGAFMETMAVHLDGAPEVTQAFVLGVGAADDEPPLPATLASFPLVRGRDRLDVLAPGTEDRAFQLHVFRDVLPGAALDDRRMTNRPLACYVFRDRSLRLADGRVILNEDQVDNVRAMKDWMGRQAEERPYRTAAAAIFLLASMVYVLARGPREVLQAIWRTLSFFRGELCQKCGMPLDKVSFSRLPMDGHLTAASRLITLGSSMSLDDMGRGIPEALELTRDLDPAEVAKLRTYLAGDCAWCLRCNKGTTRFTLVVDGQERETGQHQIVAPQYLEIARRCQADAATPS